jgi:putative ABC transport system ATP-binding protein
LIILRAEGLTRRYGVGDAQTTGLEHASFAIEEGEFVAIMGPSGSGKSTLMNLIGLLDRPSAGRLHVAGTATETLDHDQLAAMRNQKIGFIFQAYNLLSRSTTLENVEMPLIYSGLPKRMRSLRAKAALDAVGLSHRLHHWPTQLSGGEQQRVAIARALVGEPSLILADEPTGALDSRTGESILALLTRLHAEGRTIVLITHDMQVAQHARRLIRLQDGRIVGDDVLHGTTAGARVSCGEGLHNSILSRP